MKRASLLLVPMLLFSVSCHEMKGKSTFRKLDSNNDHKVTEAEFADHINGQSFRTLDSNKNGKISEKEWLTKEPGDTSLTLFRTFDSNSDKSITESEFSAKPGSKKRREIDAIFRTLDKNHDGGLEWNEIIFPG